MLLSETAPGDAVLPQLAHGHDGVEKSHVVTWFCEDLVKEWFISSVPVDHLPQYH